MGLGGKRIGAGRPKGSGKYAEPTKAIRLPISEIPHIFRYIQNGCYRIPFYQSTVSAGFPSPADEHIEESLDLNELLVQRPQATFFLKVSGNSMINAGIHHDDILVVDRSLEPTNGKVVIASINGELTVKRLKKNGGRLELMPENIDYAPINITGEDELVIWGVVTNVIHRL